MRLIDADELIIDFGFTWADIAPTRDEFIALIRRQKTIETDPVRVGRWLGTEDTDEAKCSNCRHTISAYDYLKLPPFCEMCGTKMEVTP